MNDEEYAEVCGASDDSPPVGRKCFVLPFVPVLVLVNVLDPLVPVRVHVNVPVHDPDTDSDPDPEGSITITRALNPHKALTLTAV